MLILDRAFEAAFRRLFVYNILFEDSEVDGRYFGLDQHSKVVGISAAGCGLASMVRFHPTSIDAVDINAHHLSLAALKMEATRRIKNYDLLYATFGYGRLTKPESIIRPLTQQLPDWIQKYWRQNYRRFSGSFYESGVTAWMLGQLRRYVGLDSAWMKKFTTLSASERCETIVKLVEPVFNRPLILGLLNSPLQQLALGINFNQKERLLSGEHPSIVEFIINHLKRVAETDLETNWFAWHAAAGHYNHDHKDAVPPYLRKQAHLSSKESPTEFHFHHRSIVDVIQEGKPHTWTHYSLCDAMDWMPRASQVRLLEEIRRTAQPGAKVLLRSVEDRDVVAECGQSTFLRRLDAESERARREDRSCQYRRVDFYEVQA